MLRAKVAKLEARLRELEVEHSGSSSSSTPDPSSPVSPGPSTTSSSPSEDRILLQPPGEFVTTFVFPSPLTGASAVRDLTAFHIFGVFQLGLG